jgi:hypothetical protein
MDQLITLSPNHLHLFIHPHPGASRLLLDLAASLALRGPLAVLDGGNCFNLYTVAQALRRGGANVRLALGRIQVARAFTCYSWQHGLQNLGLLRRRCRPNGWIF